MNTQKKVWPSGQHYSGHNRVPNIQQFMATLDREKSERDALLDADADADETHSQDQNQNQEADNEIATHMPPKPSGKNRRTVRDPVTGRDVEIADIDSRQFKASRNPMVRLERPVCWSSWARSRTKPKIGKQISNTSHSRPEIRLPFVPRHFHAVVGGLLDR
jgi:hypothetical protein